MSTKISKRTLHEAAGHQRYHNAITGGEATGDTEAFRNLSQEERDEIAKSYELSTEVPKTEAEESRPALEQVAKNNLQQIRENLQKGN